MQRYSITEEDMKRFYVLKKVQEKQMSTKDASLVLGLSYRQTLRLKKRFLTDSMEGIIRKKPLKPPNNKINRELKEKIIVLKKNTYYDFNILHFKDKLFEIHKIKISYETLRKILIKEGLHTPRTKRKIYRRRRRMPQSGLLVQMDSSQHRWIPDINKPFWLVAMIDDADNYVYAEFHPSETALANMKVIKEYILKRGLFMALYTDKASHFKTTRHGGLHYDVSLEQEDTQIQRALKEIGIHLINANSPQAKGRIERLFRFFQDRLIKEMKLKEIKNYEEANKFLKELFLPWYNSNYTLPVENSYKELPKNLDLNTIFSLKYPRKVSKDNTISFKGKIFQLLPLNAVKNFSSSWIDVCETLDNQIILLYKNIKIPYKIVSNKQLKQFKNENILDLRENKPQKLLKKKYVPPPDHPWRKFPIFEKK